MAPKLDDQSVKLIIKIVQVISRFTISVLIASILCCKNFPKGIFIKTQSSIMSRKSILSTVSCYVQLVWKRSRYVGSSSSQSALPSQWFHLFNFNPTFIKLLVILILCFLGKKEMQKNLPPSWSSDHDLNTGNHKR